MQYGLKTIWRTPVKTALFWLLIVVVTVFLSLGVGMWNSAEHMLDEADSTFLTAGEFVFRKGHYPDDSTPDEALLAAAEGFSLSALAAHPSVLVAEQSLLQRGMIDGYSAMQRTMPYEKYVVLTVSVGRLDARYNGYNATVLDTTYANLKTENKAYFIFDHEGVAVSLEEGRKYVVFGELFTIQTQAFMGLQLMPFEQIGLTGAYPPLADVTDVEDMAQFWKSGAGQAFATAAETLAVINDSVNVIATQDMQAARGFQRGEYTLIDGRMPTEDEMLAGDVCVIGKRVADMLALSLGDTLTLSMHHATDATGRYLSYTPETGFADTAQYTVVGIYQAAEPEPPVFIPASGQPWLAHSTNDYTLASVVLDNRTAAEYQAWAQQRLPEGVVLDVFDQGYADAVVPIMGMRETAMVITAICAAACLVILFFFGFFFVYRGREAGRILWTLGTERWGILGYYLAGSGAIAAVAALMGSIIGYFISRQTIQSLYASIADLTMHDLRFSVSGYGVGRHSFTGVPAVRVDVYLLLAALVFTLAVLFCLVFAMLVIRAQNPFVQSRKLFKWQNRQRMRRTAPEREAWGARFSAKLPTMPLRYAVRSLLRGGRRSLAVPLVFIVMLTFLCTFAGTRTAFQERLSNVYDDVPVSMRLTDITGRMSDNLSLGYDQIVAIEESGFVQNTIITVDAPYMVIGMAVYADGTPADPPPEIFEMPDSPYVYETFVNQLGTYTDTLLFCSNVPFAPAFFNTLTPEFTFVPGMDWQAFYQSKNQIIVPQATLHQQGLSLGDTVSVVIFHGYPDDVYPEQMDVRIVASYDAGVERMEAYMSPSAYGFEMNENGLFIADQTHRSIKYMTFRSAGFVLQHTDRLSELKDWLSERYDLLGHPGKHRQWVLINDTALHSTIDTLTRYISYVNMLYPLAFLLVAGIGFLVSSLLLKSRSIEIGVLQSVGTANGIIFLSLFVEQLLLSIPGIAGGLLLAVLLQGGAMHAYWQATAIFALCYFAGTSLAIIQTTRNTPLKTLALKEA